MEIMVSKFLSIYLIAYMPYCARETLTMHRKPMNPVSPSLLGRALAVLCVIATPASAELLTQKLLSRLHQLDSIFAIFGAVSGGKPLYFRVWQIENRL